MVRAGSERAEVVAEFAVERLPAVRAWLAETALEGDEDRLLLRRVVDRGGRSRAFINGTAATIQQLGEVGELLVDIHGQHAHQSLVRPTAQRELLDGHAGLAAAVREVGTAYREWQRLARLRAEQETHAAARAAEREQLAWQVDELRKLAARAGRVGRDPGGAEPPRPCGEPDRGGARRARRDLGIRGRRVGRGRRGGVAAARADRLRQRARRAGRAARRRGGADRGGRARAAALCRQSGARSGTARRRRAPARCAAFDRAQVPRRPRDLAGSRRTPRRAPRRARGGVRPGRVARAGGRGEAALQRAGGQALDRAPPGRDASSRAR